LCGRKNGLKRCRLNALALKAHYRCIDLALGLGIKRAAKQRTNELNVSCFVEGRDFDEFT
jgi:hypothetical protein